MFEISTMICKLHDNVDLVLGVTNFVELEAELSMRELKFKCLNRPVSMFPANKELVKPKERRFLKVEAPFLNKIS